MITQENVLVGGAARYCRSGHERHLRRKRHAADVLFLLPDLLAGTPVLPTASAQSLWLGALGALLTTCYIFGLLARRERKVLGLGPDSLVVLITYIGGVLLLTYVPG